MASGIERLRIKEAYPSRIGWLACLSFGLLVAGLLWTEPLWAVAINSDNGLTPYKGQTIIRQQFRYTRKSDDPEPQDRESEVYALPLTLAYGITEKAAVLAKMSYLVKDLDSTTSGERVSRGDSGFGDLTLLGKYRLFKKDFPGATSRLALIGGVKFPTGQSGDADARGKLPRTLQLGSGSTDPIVATAFTSQSLADEWDLSFSYQFNTTANKFEFGDTLKYTVAYQRRMLPWELPERGVYTQFNLVLEANGVWNQKNKSHASRIDNSGGHTLFLSPGLQIATKHVIAETSVQLPVLQNLNGNQVETDFVLVASLRVTF